MDSLANYASEGENSSNSEDNKVSADRENNSSNRMASDVNYDPVQMDMSEESNNNSDESSSERGSLPPVGIVPNNTKRASPANSTSPHSRLPRPADHSSNSQEESRRSERSERDRESSHKIRRSSHDDKRRSNDHKDNRDSRRSRENERSRDEDRRRERGRSYREDRRERDKRRDRDHRNRSKESRSKDRHRDERLSHQRERDRTRSRSRSKERSLSRSKERSLSKSKERSSSSFKTLSYREEKNRNKLAQLEKLGIELKSPEGESGINDPQEQNYYNPLATATQGKYAEQIQKRKLLWANKKQEEGSNAQTPTVGVKTWMGTTFTHDQDGRVTAKFKRLMGIKGDLPSASTEGLKPEILKKQEEMFSNMEQQYEVARATTHTQRGVGLGYASGGYQFPR